MPRRHLSMILLFLLVVVSTAVTFFLVSFLDASEGEGGSTHHRLRHFLGKRPRLVKSVAFGSSTSPGFGAQPIWEAAVIPSAPDAWIWAGDMAFLDTPSVTCSATPGHPQCNCSSSWLQQANVSCLRGDVKHAAAQVQVQLSNPGYAKFLEYMCPGHRTLGLHPPPGTNPLICPRPILGTYDDSDFGWQDGDERLPDKDKLKNIFLDALGEPKGSPRRAPNTPIHTKHTLNAGQVGREIAVLLLDERYQRSPLPCHVRRQLCTRALPDPSHPLNAWCRDFLEGGSDKKGTCCTKDESLFSGWCSHDENRKHLLWAAACDPRSPQFGRFSLHVDRRGQLAQPDRSTTVEDSSFCEVLGLGQRRWLESQLATSKAALTLVISPSPLLTNPPNEPCPGEAGPGGGWDCFKPAQLALLHSIARSPSCVIVLAGDLLHSDIKVLKPGNKKAEAHIRSYGINKPIYQVMASGLTKHPELDYSCRVEGAFAGKGWTNNSLGLRENDCDFVGSPSFGMLEVEWGTSDSIVHLQVRDGTSGVVKLEKTISLKECRGTVKASSTHQENGGQ